MLEMRRSGPSAPRASSEPSPGCPVLHEGLQVGPPHQAMAPPHIPHQHLAKGQCSSAPDRGTRDKRICFVRLRTTGSSLLPKGRTRHVRVYRRASENKPRAARAAEADGGSACGPVRLACPLGPSGPGFLGQEVGRSTPRPSIPGMQHVIRRDLNLFRKHDTEPRGTATAPALSVTLCARSLHFPRPVK